MQLTINGEERIIENASTLAELLVIFEIAERMVVIERNGEIVARADYAGTGIAEGDRIEIVQMSAGG